jgi:hypothetical protein
MLKKKDDINLWNSFDIEAVAPALACFGAGA